VGGCQKKPLVLFSSRVLDCLLKLDSCSLQSLCSPQCTQKRRLQRKQTKKGRHEAFFVSLPSRHRWIDEWIRKRMIASRIGWHPRGALTAPIFIHLLFAHFSFLYLFWLFSEF
jgi:hypothetical protein